ncbi:hypothetical protein LCGC14_2794180, partial [marine sediment metagenome]
MKLDVMLQRFYDGLTGQKKSTIKEEGRSFFCSYKR